MSLGPRIFFFFQVVNHACSITPNNAFNPSTMKTVQIERCFTHLVVKFVRCV